MATKAQLYQRAQELEITGRSSMTKAELEAAIREAEAGLAVETAEAIEALAAETNGLIAAEVTPAGVLALVEEALPRICPICVEEIPSEHPYPLHERCYVSTKVFPDDAKVDTEGQIRKVKDFLEELKWRNKVDITATETLYDRALEAYKAGNLLRTARLCWLAEDKAALVVVTMTEGWLTRQVEKLRAEGYETAEIERLLIEIETLMGEGRFIKAYFVATGNKRQPGAKHLVAAARQRPRAQKALEGVAWRLELLDKEGVTPPEKALMLYKAAQEFLLLGGDPWAAQKKAGEAIELLKLLVKEAQDKRRADFADAMALGNRISPEVLENLNEQTRQRRHKVRSRKGEIEGRRKGSPRRQRVRGGRQAEKRRVNEQRVLDEPVTD